MNSFDYIVVGGGTAGCVIASRLTENDSTRVLLLEAGPAEPLGAMAVPPAWPTLLAGPANWGDITVKQAATGTSTPLARGRALGGSSAINAMGFVRGHRSSYDAWVSAGAEGWGFEDLLPYFQRSENAVGRDPGLRGIGGPLTVGPANPPNPLIVACMDAAAEQGHPLAADISGGLDVGFGLLDLNIVDGRRQSAADAYLRPVLARPNLEIVPDALVHRLQIAGDRCTGVVYSTGHELISASCSGEVILTAGSIGSAQLLMLSGIGPSEHLEKVGVDVVLDLPGVGFNFHDHPITNVVYRSARPVPAARNNHGEAFGLLRSDPALETPDFQILFLDGPGHLATAVEDGYCISAALTTPRSRGSVRLASSEPCSAPVLNPNHYDDDHDYALMVTAVRAAREIGQAEALGRWRASEVAPGPAVDDDAGLRTYIAETLGSLNHPVGTCRIGTDDLAVVDTALRVRGISGLRVADASVMPSIVTGYTIATVYAIAERAAQLISAPAATTQHAMMRANS